MKRTLTTAKRALIQLKNDPRSIALMLVMPLVLLTLLKYMFSNEPTYPGKPNTFDMFALPFLGFFPLLIMFLITSIIMLRERTGGTLERLFTTPIKPAELIFGYAIAFGLMAIIQALITTTYTYYVLDIDIQGSQISVIGIAVMNALLGVALGLFFSAFAKTEFQAIQFMPVVILPQLLLAGVLAPIDSMANWMQTLSKIMPLRYSLDALNQISTHTSMTQDAWNDVLGVTIVIVIALIVAGLTLRRKTA
ncbi:MAG: ABC transporter permease [Micrococcaceae bacterium]